MREFPASVLRPPGDVTRREFMRVMAASAALAGLTGCTVQPPDDPILPFVTNPDTPPGVVRHYATAMTIDGDAVGLVVESHEGRPTKIEGNPRHPSSLGAAGVFQQASLLQLYDPDRAAGVRRAGQPSTWSQFAAAFGPDGMPQMAGRDGAGLVLLLEPTASPLVIAQLARVRARYPAARVFFYSPVSRHAAYDGARLVFGRPLQAQLAIDRADVIVALDADFLSEGPASLRHARQWADRRRLTDGSRTMSRLYAAETMATPTGASADARVAMRPSEIARAADALLSAIEGGGAPEGLSPSATAWVTNAARDLAQARGRGIVMAGDRQPAIVHALAAAANVRLGNVGQTVTFTEPTWLDAGQPTHTLPPLVDFLQSGEARVLMILGGNPIYAAPDVFGLADAFARVPHVAYLGPHENETAARARWMVAEAHYLESWGDAAAYDGTASIVQPLIAPLHDGRTVAEVLAMIDGDAAPSGYRLTRERWLGSGDDREARWSAALQSGIIDGTALPAVTVDATPDTAALHRAVAALPQPGTGLELVAVTGTVYDGRFANNPWLQELPQPLSKLTWGNAAYMNERTAADLHVATGTVIDLQANGRTARAPALVLPGVADGSVALALGYGRTGGESIAAGIGARTAALLGRDAPYAVAGVAARVVMVDGQDGPMPLIQPMPLTQEQDAMEGRPIALAATLDAWRRDPDIAHEQRRLPTLYNAWPLADGPQWGMAIDLTVCTGCSACVVACQSENNIPVVGAPGVLEHRAMHWLRIDRYFTPEASPSGSPGEAERGAPRESAPSGVVMQPMLCQQCEDAPCEYVCPVNATVHSDDGLNEMVYNRCVGTRFCSNNCPYKVRRFNWFDYNASLPEVRRMAMNPDVTVRERGVMEKCTFCVQRIREAQISARVDGRSLAEGDVVTACQQACPTRAIVFGRVNDPGSEVSRLHGQARAYAVLNELGTRPRVRYLPKITNPPDTQEPS
jgi:molybdopterin-containing oxidoreductase family iron-sulfur binding subunit